MYLIRSPGFKTRTQQQYQFQKAHKHMENKQCSPESSMGQGRNKGEIKDFLNFDENDHTTYPNLMRHNESSVKRKVRSP